LRTCLVNHCPAKVLTQRDGPQAEGGVGEATKRRRRRDRRRELFGQPCDQIGRQEGRIRRGGDDISAIGAVGSDPIEPSRTPSSGPAKSNTLSATTGRPSPAKRPVGCWRPSYFSSAAAAFVRECRLG
jgi:hypothetical protein